MLLGKNHHQHQSGLRYKLDLTSLVVFVCVLNTITIVAIVAWLEKIEKRKKDNDIFYYEEIEDDNQSYNWDD